MMKHKTTIFNDFLRRTQKNKKAGKKGGIFKRIANRPTKQELQNLTDYYNKLTAAISDDFAMQMLDSQETRHYLRLIKIADYHPDGKSFSILTAFKLGYLANKPESHNNKFDIEENICCLAVGIEKIQYLIENFADTHKLYKPTETLDRSEKDNFYFHRDNMRIEIDCIDDYVIQATDNLNELRKNIGI